MYGDNIARQNLKTNEDTVLTHQQHNGQALYQEYEERLSECENDIGESIQQMLKEFHLECKHNIRQCNKCENCSIQKIFITKQLFNKNILNHNFSLHKNCIKELCISDCGIKEFPEAVSSLVNLTVLDLSRNKLSTIPDTCVLLTKLRALNLSHNEIGNTVPNCLELGLSLISNLNLSNNQIYSFPRPKCIGFLQYLNISCNNLSAPGWLFSGQCRNLIELDVSHTYVFHYNFEDKVKETKFHLTNFFKSIERLIAKNTLLSVPTLHVIKHFQNLKSLNIGNDCVLSKNERSGLNTILDLPMDMFCNVEQITELNLNNVRLSILPNNFHKMKNLKVLHAARNILTWLPDGFAKLSNLEVLDLSSNRLIYLPSDFNKLVNIRELYLSNNKLSDIHKDLLTLVKLEALDLYSCHLEVLPVTYEQLRKLNKCDLELNFLHTSSLQHTYEDGLDACVWYQQLLGNLRTSKDNFEFRLQGNCPSSSANKSEDLDDSSSVDTSSLSDYDCEDEQQQAAVNLPEWSETEEENWDDENDYFHPCNYIPPSPCNAPPNTRLVKTYELFQVVPGQFDDVE